MRARQPVRVDARGGERLGDPPRLGDAERLELVAQLVLGVGGVERVERGAGVGAAQRLVLERDQALGGLALDARPRRSG